MNLAENESNNNKKIVEHFKIRNILKIFSIPKKIIIISIIVIFVIFVLLPAIIKLITIEDGKENPNNPKNGPAAANEFINNVYLDENGNLKLEKSIGEFWDEMKQKGNALTKYLNSSQELAKLFSASIATDYPDTRPDPDEPIDWEKLDLDTDSTDVQGIIKFKRALSSGDKITMTYLPASEFQEKIDKYNDTGKEEDKEEAMKYFTLEKASTSTSSGGYVDIGSRSLNNDPLEASDKVVDIHGKTNNLFYKQFDAVQSASFDGKYIICSANEGKGGNHGGRVFWIDIETGKVLPNYVTIGNEGHHMTGQTYDCDRKVVLVTSVGNKKLIQIDNETKQLMSTKYVTIPRYFHVITYSATTKQLIGYNDKKLTFMTYDPNENQYKEDETIPVSTSFNFPLQGMSTDGQVIYFLDSTNDSSKKDKFRVWVYDFKGNLIEEHKIGDSFRSTASEVEDCFCDKEGNLWLVMPYEATKVANYKAFPIDWENGCSAMPSSTESTSGNSEKVQELLKYACSWKGKVKYEKGKHEELKEGAKESCSGFIFRVYEYFNLMSEHKSAKEWKNGVPGTVELGKDLSKASPGDIIWKQNSDDCHISIYLGNKKRIHSSPGNEGVGIGKIKQSSVHKIFHFTELPTDPKAYFDPETGIYHSSNNSTSTSNTSTASSSSNVSNTSSSSSKSGQAIVDEAEKYVDILPYVPGGKSLTTGADCSGFVWAVLTKLGIIDFAYVPDTGFRTKGTKVNSLNEAQAGDVICYDGHVAFYDGHGGIIHEANEQEDCKHGSNAAYTTILTIRRFVDSNNQIAYNNDRFIVDKSARISSMQNAKIKPFNDRDYRATQSACYDGKHVIYAQNANKGKTELSNDGGRIAWIDMETGKFVTSVNVGKEGGHMDGVAYDSDRNMVLKPSSSKEGNLLQIDNNTKAIASQSHVKMSKYCDKLTYISSKHQLVGLNGGKLYFMSWNEQKKEYEVKDEVKLENYKMYSGAQGIGTDGQNIFIADSNKANAAGVDPSQFRVWVYTLDGKKVGEHLLDESLGDREREVESAFGDKDGNLWLACPDYFEKVTNYKVSSGGDTTSSTTNNQNAGSYVVKVATWQESSEVVKSTDSSEDRNENNHSMSTKTIPYQNAIAQYRMPFNYLWAMLLISQDKQYTFDLADLVRNSKIEITIHDNLEETTTIVKETYDQKYIYTGSADIKMECMDVPSNEPNSNMPQPIIQPTFNITKNGSGEDTVTSTYKKETTTVNKVNTLDVALTLADTWCVKYEKEYEYNGEQTDNSNSTETIDVPKVEGEEENKITNSNLLNKIKEDAKEKMNAERASTTIVTNSEVVAGTEKQTIDIEATTKEITTEVTTVKSNYTGKPEKFTEDTEGEGRFVDLFNKNYKARSNILSTKDWLFEILESNEDTVNMVDLTKYLIYRATDTAIDEVTTYSFSEYDLNNFIDANGNSSNSIYGNTFEEKVWYTLSEKYSEIAAAGAMGNFDQESGFKSNNLQDGYESILGHSDESYTAAVNNGSYSRDKFIKDEAGYGLAQWTSSGRKAGLYDLAKQEGTGIDNEETQIKFLLREIENYCTTWQKSTTVSDAAVRFHNEMEKSNDSPSELQKRVKSAEQLYNKYKGKKRPASAGTPGTFPRYYQSDSRWASKRYGPDSMAEAGCGACALAMAVSGLTGRTVEPPEIVDYLNSKGIATAYEAEGTNASRAIANKYKLTLEVINKSNKSKIDEALDQGKVCMFSISYSGIYNDAVGHYILCYKKDNRGYYIVESGKYYDSNTPYTWSQTMGASNNGGMVNVLGK